MAFPTAIPNQVIKSVTITSTKEEITVEGRITCSTKNFLYMLWSSKDPESQYCGSSGREVRTRCGEHRGGTSATRLCPKLSLPTSTALGAG